MSGARLVEPLEGPIDAVVRVPGSKSYTNRALVLAALAEGTSRIEGALFANDTEAMCEALVRLGVDVSADASSTRIDVGGHGPALAGAEATIDARLSGTTARFLLPLLALGEGHHLLDGGEPLRRRPMGPAIDALRSLGAEVDELGAPGCLPLRIARGNLHGGAVRVRSDLSSQFVSGLLLAGAALPGGLDLTIVGEAVSRPYHEMTVSALASFGIHVERPSEGRFVIAVQPYRATRYEVEPDASAASYFFAAAAICGGRVRVEGLGSRSLQGDLQVVELLASMGAAVEMGPDWTEVRGDRLHGIDVEMSDLPDMAQTIAVVAAFADGETRVRGVEVIRHHETDRIEAVVAELRRCGVPATPLPDGFVVGPGRPSAARIRTYDDHRMAMSFSLMGLRVPGIEVEDPECVAKTYPGFFDDLERLRTPAGGDRVGGR